MCKTTIRKAGIFFFICMYKSLGGTRFQAPSSNIMSGLSLRQCKNILTETLCCMMRERDRPLARGGILRVSSAQIPADDPQNKLLLNKDFLVLLLEGAGIKNKTAFFFSLFLKSYNCQR